MTATEERAAYVERILDLASTMTPEQLRGFVGTLDPDLAELVYEILSDSFVVDADAFDLLDYRPNPGPQTELHRLPIYSDGGPFDALYGGAAFGGKSYGLLMDGLAKAHQYPGLEVWAVRNTYPQLYDSFIRVLERRLGFGRKIGATWNASRHELRLPNGSLIAFRHARNMQDAADMLSAECQYLILDERTRLDPKVVDALSFRVRSGDPSIPIVGIRSGSNPGGPGHSTVKSQFVDPNPNGGVLLDALDPETGTPIELAPGRPMTRLFIRARISDNPAGRAADPTYEARLNLLPPDLRGAYRDGDWGRFEGMRFSRFDPVLHIGDPADYPLDEVLEGSRGIGIDFGTSAPFAAIFGSKVRSDLFVVYRELHVAGLNAIEQAERILDVEADGERDGNRAWIDPSTWARNPDQPRASKTPGHPPAGSVAYRYQETGVPVRKAHNDRVTGWSAIDDLLSIGDDGAPKLIVLSSCPNVIRSLTGAPRDDTNPEDVDPKYLDDHALDAFRYLVMGMFGAPSTEATFGRPSAQRSTIPSVRPNAGVRIPKVGRSRRS